MNKRMTITFLAVCFSLAAQEIPTIPAPVPRLGMNLAGACDWNTELPFVDVFRLSRLWISQRKGAKWGKGPKLSLDKYGWITKLESDCYANTPLCTIRGGHYPSGEYNVFYKGKGKFEFRGSAKFVRQEKAGHLVIAVDANKGGIWLRIAETDPQDYLRDIRVIMPGFETTYEENPFHPDFLARWQGVNCLRFMDFMDTNNSEITRWNERPLPEDANWTTHGIPLEIMADLANRLDAAPWFCMPHLADDNYIRNFAQQAKELLNPDLKVYLEWSNEVWNGQFAQNRYAGKKGQELGFAEKPWEAAWCYTAHRSVQIFDIWEEVFGNAERLVRVLPSQAANAYVSGRILAFQDSWKHADALAIAPYISFNIPSTGKKGRPGADQVISWSVEQFLDHMESHSLPQCVDWMQKQKKAADKYGLRLIAYEGGQHANALGAANQNKKLIQLMIDANSHPRMGQLYTRYLQAWKESGGDLFCNFSSVSRWSRYGCWGLMQHYDESREKSPKFQAVMKWAAEQGQSVSLGNGER